MTLLFREAVLSLGLLSLYISSLIIINCIMQAWIEWYGESTVSLVRKSYIKTLKEGVGKRLKLKPLTEDLKNAINLAIIEATKQVSD